MKKQLNVDLIQSELRGGSAFFPGYKGNRSSIPSISATEATPTPEPIPRSRTRASDHVSPRQSDQRSNSVIDSSTSKQGVPPPVPRPVPRTESRTAYGKDYLVPKVKRPMKQRQPFDIYEDQYERLKQIADSERNFVNGRGMSQMVREAIDAYLATNISANKK